MRAETRHYQKGSLSTLYETILGKKADLVFYFGARKSIENGSVYHALKNAYPNSIILGCSTGGEIFDHAVFDQTVATLALDFEKTKLKYATTDHLSHPDGYEAGQYVATQLKRDDLRGIFVIADGLLVNASQFVKGMESILGKDIPIVGGLAGDGETFQTTLVGLNNTPAPGQMVGIGFYGHHFHIGYGSAGGWDPHGPIRKITKSSGNILYEVDGKPASDFYKGYLGKLASEKRNYALFYPFSVWPDGEEDSAFIRSVLSLNDEDKSITFTGEIPEGYNARLMRGLIPKLLDGAYQAGKQIALPPNKESVAILISCMGRRIVLGNHAEDEIISVSEALPQPHCHQVGFYSYGEISPRTATHVPELHNQTMTVTTFYED